MPKRIKSGYINDPEKILIHSDQDRTGSYPTIARTGDHDFSGKSASTFDDTDTIVFASGTANVMYPVMLRTGSKYMTNDILNTGYWSGILAPGAVMPGVSDNKVRLGSRESISPFDESRVYIDNDTQFYATGTASGTLPGFSQRLSSKTIIQIDCSAAEKTTVVFSTGTAADASGYAAGVNSGLAYYNFQNKRWEVVGDLTTGSNIDYYNPDINVFTSSMLSTIPAGYWAVGLASWDMAPFNEPLGGPSDAAGFPYATKFNATSSQFYDTTSSLSAPFLVEKISFNISASLGQYPLIGSNVAEQPCVSTFMLMLQRQQPITGTNTTTVETVNFSPNPDVLTSSLASFDFDKDRRIIGYARIGRYSTVSHATTDSIIEEFGQATFDACDLWVPTASSSKISSGSFRVDIIPQVPSPAPRVGAPYDARSNQSKFSRLIGRKKSGRDLQESSDGRSFIRSTIGSRVVSSSQSFVNTAAGNLPFQSFDAESQPSPFVMLPGDKLVLAYANQTMPFMVSRDNEGDVAHKYKNEMLPGRSSVTLFGSLLQQNLPKESSTNQPLTSNAIHEDLHYDNVVYDQWDVEPYSSLTGSYVDNLVTGSMFAASSDNIFGDPFATGARQVVASVAAGQAGDRSSLARFVRFRDPFETLFDSFPPDAGQVFEAMGFGAGSFNVEDGGSALTASFLAPSSPDAGPTSRGFNPGWYTSTAFEFIQERKPSPGVLTSINLEVFNTSDASLGNAISPTKEVFMATSTGYVADTNRHITDGTGTRRTPNAQRNSKKALWGTGRNKNAAPAFADDHGKGYVPVIRGYKYGLAGIDGLHPTVIFRRDQYGQFRDMLEQRLDYSVYGAENEVVRPIDIKFVPQDSVVGGTTSPSNTHSQNLSNFATASIPYHDGLARDRSDNPDTSLEPIDINILGNLL